jgi:hypothetical protein
MKKIIAITVATGAAVLAIVGGAAAANASSGPSTTPHAPNTVLAPVDGAPDLSKVKEGKAVDTGQTAVVVGETGTTGAGPALVEVPGAAPDLSEAEPGVALELPDEPLVIGGGGKTAARR